METTAVETSAAVKAAVAKAKEAARKKLQKFQKKKTIDFQDFQEDLGAQG